MIVADPRESPHCWATALVSTPDATVHQITCGRGRHRFGQHRNRHVAWRCTPNCRCVRHARRSP